VVGCYLSSPKVNSATFQLSVLNIPKGKTSTKQETTLWWGGRRSDGEEVQRARGDAVHPTQPQPVLVTKQQIPSSKVYSPLVRARAGEGKFKIAVALHLSRLVSCGLAAPVLSATNREIPEVYHGISSNTREISCERKGGSVTAP
jgi:hypothetical protein